jgi:hypothetical protein
MLPGKYRLYSIDLFESILQSVQNFCQRVERVGGQKLLITF